MTLAKIVLAATAAVLATTSAHATDVTTIRIQNGIPTWLQIAEIQAFKYGSATNIALTATATATSVYTPAFSANKANDGVTAGDFYATPGYHSGSESGSEFFDLTFAAPVDLQSFTIFGRTDNNGNLRDLYTYTLYNGANIVGTGTLDARSTSLVSASFGSSVPEPASWAMLLVGFGMIGAGVRYRRRSTGVAYA